MKITCEIIGDLLPLYVDNVLSNDSCRLIEDHLADCDSCRARYEELQDDSAISSVLTEKEKAENQGKAFKMIKHRIRRKQIISVCIAVICVLLAVKTVYYLHYEKEDYIAWEDTGLYVEDGKMYASKTWEGRMMSITAPNQRVQFYVMKETAYIKKLYPDKPCKEMIADFEEQHNLPTDQYLGETAGLAGLEKVYYLPEEYYDDACEFDYENPEKGEQQTKELEKKAILLWQASDEKTPDAAG